MSKVTMKRGIILMLCSILQTSALSVEFSGGTGEPNDPYQIGTASDLILLGESPEHYNKHFILTANIDLDPNLPGGKVFDSAVIAPDANMVDWFFEGTPFFSVFNGNGNKILNFSCTSTGKDNVGLFGSVYLTAEIKDLGLINHNVDAGTGNHVGSLVGFNRGTITNCYAQDVSVSGDCVVGGLVGRNFGTLSACYTQGGTVSGNDTVGGLLGYNGDKIVNCYSTSDVEGNKDVGGLVGHNGLGEKITSTITNCYATGSVAGNENVGGLSGFNSQVIFRSFWDIETSGQTTSAGGLGKTTAEMQMASTYNSWSACSNEGIWTIDEGNDYPRLWWENKPGQPIEPTQLSDLLTGSGTQDDPFLIYTAEEMNTIGLFPCDWDKYFKLMADIDLKAYTGTTFNIIGCINDGCNYTPFTGIFDGCGHTISNFNYRSTEINAIGLFGYVNDPNAEIKNLGLIDPNVNLEGGIIGYVVGSLVGELRSGNLTNCYAEGGRVSNDTYYAGGLVGLNNGVITNCYSTNSVSGNDAVGGLVGSNGDINMKSDFSDVIFNSYSTGSVSGNDAVGGLVGANNGTITSCYSTGSVSGHDNIGGLVGLTRSGIKTCYSISNVSGNKSVGGLVGGIRSGIINCYSSGSVSGQEYVGGLTGFASYGGKYTVASFWDIETSGQTISSSGSGKTTAEMQTASTFLEAGWDFVGEIENGTEDIWWILEDKDYPRLWWED